MPFNLLLLPLLGGFLFVSRLYATRYTTLRSDGYRLLFHSALWGTFLLFSAAILAETSVATDWGETLADFWYGLTGLENSGRPALALVMGLVLPSVINGVLGWTPWFSDARAMERAIVHKADPLEMMLRQALGNQLLISVTLKSGKVYVGRLFRNINPAFPVVSIALHLIRSGYREKETLAVRFTTDYANTHASIMEQALSEYSGALAKLLRTDPRLGFQDATRIVERSLLSDTKIEPFEIIIPVSEIQTVNLFDPKIYGAYFAATEAEKRAPAVVAIPVSTAGEPVAN